jgi:WXXGXW repeat (2 copies)/Glycine zipper
MTGALGAGAASLLLAVLLAGCTTPTGAPDYTGSGALIGGASGAGLGAALDRANPGAGALIGGAAGLITGGVIGHAMDQQASRPVYVMPTPPPPMAESVVPAPGPGYLWMRGYWEWNGSGWVWAAGHWVLPPYPQSVWVAPGWVQGPRGWYWQQGYWR